jgi:large subunit ribosomal protein L33
LADSFYGHAHLGGLFLHMMMSSAGTGHCYVTTKNKKTTADKLELKPYDRIVRKHVVYREGKLK